MAETQEQASAARKAAQKKTQEEAAAALKKANEERSAERIKSIEAAQKLKPTPTQLENDLAALGVDVPEKEPDGSGPTVITRTVVANRPLGAYETRAVAAGDKAAREAALKEIEAEDKAAASKKQP
jgi:hypothetical protein